MIFKYVAMDKTGLEVVGSVEAENQEDAQAQIRQKGYFVTKITNSEKKFPGARGVAGILLVVLAGVLITAALLYCGNLLIPARRLNVEKLEYNGHQYLKMDGQIVHDPDCTLENRKAER